MVVAYVFPRDTRLRPEQIDARSLTRINDAFDAFANIAGGTRAGVGMVRNPPLFIKHGDVCEIEIEGIGILCNAVEDE